MSSIAPSSHSRTSRQDDFAKSSPTSSLRKSQYKAVQDQYSLRIQYQLIPTTHRISEQLIARFPRRCAIVQNLKHATQGSDVHPKLDYQLHDVRSLTSLACSCYGLVAVSPHGPCVRWICTSLTVPAPESFYPTVFSNPSTQSTEVPSPWRRHRPSNHNVRRRRSASECPETATKAAVLWWSLPTRPDFLSVVAIMLPGMLLARTQARRLDSLGPALRWTRPEPWTSSIYRERSFRAVSTEIQ
jgi:hypothetical protein